MLTSDCNGLDLSRVRAAFEWQTDLTVEVTDTISFGLLKNIQQQKGGGNPVIFFSSLMVMSKK